jgi:hypothetical protein
MGVLLNQNINLVTEDKCNNFYRISSANQLNILVSTKSSLYYYRFGLRC